MANRYHLILTSAQRNHILCGVEYLAEASDGFSEGDQAVSPKAQGPERRLNSNTIEVLNLAEPMPVQAVIVVFTPAEADALEEAATHTVAYEDHALKKIGGARKVDKACDALNKLREAIACSR